ELTASLFLFFALALLTQTSRASFDVPLHSVEPEFNGLNIKYYVRATSIKITLNVINHSEKDALCDAQYRSGPQTYNAKEIIIGSGQADSFTFRYGRKTEKVKLHLKCVPMNKPEDNTENTMTENKTDDSNNDDSLKNNNQETETPDHTLTVPSSIQTGSQPYTDGTH
ncbi:MAG: hypothetical protein KDI30_09910, partial [Pseudomonadales bacterium]|nr:hypothetical protein [Pseudomonadales bacterium]